MNQSTERAANARRLLRSFYSGVLGTRSVRYPDYPYTAALPFCTDQQGRVIVFISHLAEHTKALEREARVSFTVSPMVPHLRPQARLTILGKIAPNDDAQVAARYLRFFPDNRHFLEIGGFRFFRIDPDYIRLIEGFGSAHWLRGDSILTGKLPIADAEESIIDHMNTDHGDSLAGYCRHVYNVDVMNARMTGIDCDGFDVRADDRLYRFEFDTRINNAADARSALVALSQAARQ